MSLLMKQLKIAYILFGVLCVLILSGATEAMADDNRNSNPKAEPGFAGSSVVVVPATKAGEIILKNGIRVHDVASTDSAEPIEKSEKHGKTYLVPLGKPKIVLRSLARSTLGKPVPVVTLSNNIIGAPYDTYTNSIVSSDSCLEGVASYSTSGSSILTFDQIQYQDSLFKSLGVSVGIDAEVGPVKASLTAEFVNSSLDDSRSINMYFTEGSTSTVYLKFIEPVVSDAINRLKPFYRELYLSDQKDFKLKCSKGYVGEAREGALLIVRLTLRFDSEVAKDEFVGKMNLDIAGGLLDITAKIKKAVTDTKQNATLTINALQRGGNPLKLVGVFGIDETAASNAEAAGQIVFPAMDCGTGANVDEACKKTIASIIKYGQESMPEQVEHGRNLYYDLPVGVPYSTIGLDENPDIEIPQRKVFSSEYAKANKSMLFISNYTHQGFPIDVNLRSQLVSISKKLRYQIDSIFYNFNVVDHCYTAYFPGLCQEDITWANSQLNDDTHKLSVNEKDTLEYLERNQYELGGSGLWRGEKGLGACGFIPVTTAKEGHFYLDCGQGNSKPIPRVVAKITDSEIKIPYRLQSGQKLSGLSYKLRDASGVLHEVECFGEGHNEELVFKPQEKGSRTYFAKNAKCFLDYKTEFGVVDEDGLTLERKS